MLEEDFLLLVRLSVFSGTYDSIKTVQSDFQWISFLKILNGSLHPRKIWNLYSLLSLSKHLYGFVLNLKNALIAAKTQKETPQKYSQYFYHPKRIQNFVSKSHIHCLVQISRPCNKPLHCNQSFIIQHIQETFSCQ